LKNLCSASGGSLVSQGNPFPTDHLTELLHEKLLISAFRREDESNQQLLRFYKIERILIFGRIQIGMIYLSKGKGFDCFPNFSTLILKFKLNLTSVKRSNILKSFECMKSFRAQRKQTFLVSGEGCQSPNCVSGGFLCLSKGGDFGVCRTIIG